jgi:uncharacterized delta-60 repeat protein
MIGPAGGTVTGPNGAKVVIPAGALTSDTLINITQTSAGSPVLLAGFSATGFMFEFTPHGITFAIPVTMTLPFNGALVPAGNSPQFYKTNALNQWEQIANAIFGVDSVSAQVAGFSHATVVTPPLTRDDPWRLWQFRVFPADGSAEVILPCHPASCMQVGGLVDDLVDFGSTDFSPGILRPSGSIPLNDGIADGYVLSTANGVTYAVLAEAPTPRPGTSDPNGGAAYLTQRQSFIKRASDASLKFTVTDVIVEAGDFASHDARAQRPIPLMSEVMLDVVAYKTPNAYFFHGAGYVAIVGDNEDWVPAVTGVSDAPAELWQLDDFDVKTSSNISYTVGTAPITGTCSGTRGFLRLKKPLTYSVDLSSIGVNEEFSLRVITHAQAWNRKGGRKDDCQANYAYAVLQDPLAVGGTTLVINGLEATNRPLPGPPEQQLVAPAACVPGPGPSPAAGVLQFDAANFTVDEHSAAVPTVTVSRSGGSSGAVTATFTTSDGTAVAGSNYSAVNATVFFGDGKTGSRVVSVPIIGNQIDENDKTVNLTLSQPGGCAALGGQTTSVLTIRDDDTPPSVNVSIGGTVTGLGGSGVVLTNIGLEVVITANGAFSFPTLMASGLPYNVQLKTQPSNPNQVCTITNGAGITANANITNVAVNCVTPPANGSLDLSFGNSGKVSTAFGGDDTAMALQGDGKIVMVGGSSSDFVLARYNADGVLDTSFGSAGFVTTDIAGAADEAHGIAIQSDGKIVVVGSARVGANDDFAIVRYNVNGTLDTSFGTLGKVTTDINGGTDAAHGVAIQSDGKIVVVGNAALVGTDFVVARYAANGVLDAGFGANGNGKVSTDIVGGTDLARNVVLRSNGAMLVSGPVTQANDSGLDHAGLASYDANGVLDASFGTGGKVFLSGMRVGEGLAVQRDGKIVLGGSLEVGVFPARASQFALLRLSANGGTDSGFGVNGLVTTAFTSLGDFGRAVVLQSDDKIVVVGQSSNQSNPDFAVARYNTDGALDTSFALDGKLIIDFFGSFDGAEGAVVQSDGNFVVGGFARNGARTGYALVRVFQ